MLKFLSEIAKDKGLIGLEGEILWDNKAMIHIIKTCEYKNNLETSIEDGDWLFSFSFD